MTRYLVREVPQWMFRRHAQSLFAAALAASAIGGTTSAKEDFAPIEITCVDEQATHYGTFQSHCQKVLANAGGVFMTHIRTRNEAYTAQQWRLSGSTDGGRTFRTIYEATHATNPAVIESDENENLYLVRPDFIDNNSYLYFFAAADDYKNPRITRIPDSGPAGKYALAYDASRKQLYYAANNNSFHVVGLDGAVRRSIALWRAGAHAVVQYPSLCIDAGNTLHVAWTTSLPQKYMYWDIHYAKSDDGGETWKKMDGTPLSIPIDADDTGPSDRISNDDEFEVHSWLSNFLIRDGKAHFLYLAQFDPPRQHYMRYHLATAQRDVDVSPKFKGKKIELNGLDGFFAASAEALYCIGHTPDGHIGCLASFDNGATWRDHAVSRESFEGLYSVGGCREVTPGGTIIGSFTSDHSIPDSTVGDSKVYFFQIGAAEPPAAR